MALNLPKELVDYITDLIHDSDADDWRTLTTCALFHPVWAERALTHLSSGGITLNVDWPDCPDFAVFASILQSPSIGRVDVATATLKKDIATAIHRLTICSPVPTNTPTADDLLPLSEPVPLEHLPNLRVLTLRHVMIPDISSFATLLTQCTTIEELCIQGLALEVTATTAFRMALDAVRNIEPSGHPVLPHLQKLRLLDFIDAFSQLLSSALAVVIYHTAPPTPIRTLGLHSTSLCGAGIHDPSGWYEAITHIRDTLICLSVSVAVALDRFPEHLDGTRFPTAICRCERICHFALRYRPGPYLRLTHWDQPDYFLNSVRLMFSYTPPRFARVLESFILAMPYEPPPYGPGSILGQLTHLIKALLNTESYPALTTLHVCITYEKSDMATDPTAPNDPPPLPEARTWVESITAVLEPLCGRGVEVETKFMRADKWDARYG